MKGTQPYENALAEPPAMPHILASASATSGATGAAWQTGVPTPGRGRWTAPISIIC